MTRPHPNILDQLTKLENRIIKIFDRRDIRIRIPRLIKNKSKWPLIENWTKYYSEPWTIQQLLAKGFNYGIRTGKRIGNYYNVVIDLDDIWAEQRIKSSRYVETNQGIHFYLLIRELPKSSFLVNENDKKVGELHSRGRQIVGVGSIHEKGTRYSLRGRTNIKFSLKLESLKELANFLKERGIFIKPWNWKK